MKGNRASTDEEQPGSSSYEEIQKELREQREGRELNRRASENLKQRSDEWLSAGKKRDAA